MSDMTAERIAKIIAEGGAECECCKRRMLRADGCAFGKIHIGGKIYDRIRCGDEKDFIPNMKEDERCHDCGAKKGYFHHWNCDAERCPVCGEQLIFCDCEDVYVDEGCKTE